MSVSKDSDVSPQIELSSDNERALPKGSGKPNHALEPTYLDGWRKYAVFAACQVAMFLGNIEATIVNTALVSISDDLGEFDKISWIVSAYLLGFVGVVIINAKLSDIFGRKALLVLTFAIFIVFSAACGAAQTMDQLIVFRALKGLGGAGLVSLPVVTMYEVVPPNKYPKYATLIALVPLVVNILGPVLGGVISQDSTWRWVFLMNIPIAVPFAVLVAVALPPGFPYHGNPQVSRRSLRTLVSRATIQRVDFTGSALLIIATTFFVAAFQEAGKRFEWKSGFVITLLVLSGLLWILFMLYERWITGRDAVMEPVFPWRFVQNRAWIGMLLVATIHGAAWVIPVYQIPQRLQVLYGYSPLEAAVRLLPFTATTPVTMIMTGTQAKKGHAPIYYLLVSTILQIIGFALLSTVPYRGSDVLGRQYGYSVIAGLGVGPALLVIHLLVPFVVQPRDKGVGSSATTQARYMGAVLGLSIVTTAMNSLVRSRLDGTLPADTINEILSSPAAIARLPPGVQDGVREIFADGFNVQMKILAGLCGLEVVGCLMMWKKPQIKGDGTYLSEEAKMGRD